MLSKKFFLTLVVALVFLIQAPIAKTQQNVGQTYVINIWYNGTDVIVDKVPPLNVGDRLEYRATQGDFILTWVNPFNDNGWTVRSKNGVWISPPIQYLGTYHANCALNIGGWFINSEYGTVTTGGGGHGNG